MLTKLELNSDERRESIYNVFPKINGQINISYVSNTDAIIGLHKHLIQSDYLFCVKGSFKVCLVHDAETVNQRAEYIYLSERNPMVLLIEPNVWHGFRALQPNSIMLYWLSEKYNPNDEFKVEPYCFGVNWNIHAK